MSKFAAPGTPSPKTRLVAPASFSRRSAESLALRGVVAASDLSEDAQDRQRRMRRKGTVRPATHPSKLISPCGRDVSAAEHGAKSTEKCGGALADTPWWVQNTTEIYISQKIKHKKEQKIKDDAHNETLLAHAALLKQREDNAAERRRSHAVADKAQNIPMPVKIEQLVVVSKMRDKDIKRDISDVNKKLQLAATKRVKDRQTLKDAMELIKLREEELTLTRERMVHLYRAASEVVVKQSQLIGGAEDDDLALFLDKTDKKKNAPLYNEMVTYSDMQKATALYAKYSRIEELWAKLRAYAFTVGKVGLRRKRAMAMAATQQRAQFHQTITDTIYNMEPVAQVDIGVKVPSRSAGLARKAPPLASGGSGPLRKASTIGSAISGSAPPPASPAAWSGRKTIGGQAVPQPLSAKNRSGSSEFVSAHLMSPPPASPLIGKKSMASSVNLSQSQSSRAVPPPPPV